jgi:hypothetical protein
MTKDLNTPGRSSFSGATYEGSVNWSPLTYSNLILLARRRFAEPTEVGSSFIVVDFLSASWTHSWSDRLRSTLGGIYGRQQHQGIGRIDTYTTLDARLTYALHPRLRVGAQLRHDSRTSPDPTLEYTRNLTLITLETSL